jgi:hypothetical protein
MEYLLDKNLFLKASEEIIYPTDMSANVYVPSSVIVVLINENIINVDARSE